MPWTKGQSGNPGGRPKAAAEVQELARAHTTEAIERLVEIMRGRDATEARHAAETLLNRGWGRPPQAVAVTAGPSLVDILRALGPVGGDDADAGDTSGAERHRDEHPVTQ